MEQNSTEQNLPKEDFSKLIVSFSILALLFILLFGRLFYLQIIESGKLKKVAQMQHESKVVLRSERGDIFDRNGRLLASTVKSTSYAIDPSILKDSVLIDKICDKISKLTETPKQKYFDKIFNSKGSFVWLARGLTLDSLNELDTLKAKGFIRIIEPKRHYLYGSVCSQVIGCTDIDNNGLTGIEFSYDSLLKGGTKYITMLRDASGKLLPNSASLQSNTKGNSVKLTIDIDLQRIAENELRLGVAAYGSVSGTVVILNPETGEILAMASYPTFDPNNLAEVIEGAMKNRAISDQYEPGSTFKLITAATAIEENLSTSDEIVDGNNGTLELGDVTITDEHPVGKVTLREAFEKSSNIVFSTIASKITPNQFFKYIRDFGFGNLNGIELPGEAKGIVKSPQQMDAITKRFLGFGYGIAVTPLQLAIAYASIANNGELMKSYIISEVKNSMGKVIISNKPEKIRRVISEGTSKILTGMLVGVVNKGTGSGARIQGFNIAGKTGTAQQIISGKYSKQNYTASFTGYLPAEKPQLLISIVLDKPTGNYYGGATAAPLFRNIARSCISISHGILLEKTDNKNMSDSLSNGKAFVIPDLRGIKSNNLTNFFRNIGLNIQPDISNDQIIIDQIPKPYDKISDSAKINLLVSNQKPNTDKVLSKLIGLPLRKALTHLHLNNCNTIVSGSGRVMSYLVLSNKKDNLTVKLYCK